MTLSRYDMKPSQRDVDLASEAWDHQAWFVDYSMYMPSLIVASLIAVSIGDWWSPYGVADWVLYFVPLLLSFVLRRPQGPVVIALAVLILLVLGHFMSPPGPPGSKGLDILNRSFAIPVIIALGVAGYVLIKSRLAVAQRKEELLSANKTLATEMKLRADAQAAMIRSQRMEAFGQLTGGIAHDFNNLLAVIMGNLARAEARITDAKALDAVHQANDAVKRGVNLNKRLLSFSSQRQLCPQMCNINQRVHEMLPMLRRTLGAHIEVPITLEPNLWSARVDPGEIDSALINLALNARDAMPDGGEINISTSNISLDTNAPGHMAGAQAGDYVLLAVADTGHGMPPEVLARATEPFFTTKDIGKGTGLGLSSIFGFCKQSGGFLSIASTVGKGTTANIYLPRQDSIGSPAMDTAEEVPMGDGELILVVEDNEMLREVTLHLLEGLDYTVIEASNGAEALKVLETEEPVALVLCDIVMPGGISGHDVVRWLQARKHNAKILLTTGYNDPRLADDNSASDVQVLPKPYYRGQLARAVHAALQARALQTSSTSPVKT